MNLPLIISIISAIIYLICGVTKHYSAVQELARLVFVASVLAYLLGK